MVTGPLRGNTKYQRSSIHRYIMKAAFNAIILALSYEMVTHTNTYTATISSHLTSYNAVYLFLSSAFQFTQLPNGAVKLRGIEGFF